MKVDSILMIQYLLEVNLASFERVSLSSPNMLYTGARPVPLNSCIDGFLHSRNRKRRVCLEMKKFHIGRTV